MDDDKIMKQLKESWSRMESSTAGNDWENLEYGDQWNDIVKNPSFEKIMYMFTLPRRGSTEPRQPPKPKTISGKYQWYWGRGPYNDYYGMLVDSNKNFIGGITDEGEGSGNIFLGDDFRNSHAKYPPEGQMLSDTISFIIYKTTGERIPPEEIMKQLKESRVRMKQMNFGGRGN